MANKKRNIFPCKLGILACSISLPLGRRRAISSDNFLQCLVHRTHSLRSPSLRSPSRSLLDVSCQISKSQRKDPKHLEFFGFISSGRVNERATMLRLMKSLRSERKASGRDDSGSCSCRVNERATMLRLMNPLRSERKASGGGSGRVSDRATVPGS